MKKDYGVLTEEQMRKRAAEGYFVRDMEKNCVYCPMGAVLRKKSIKKSGETRYANKSACKQCESRKKCTRSPWKEVDFAARTRETRNVNWMRGGVAVELPEQEEQS